jgi:hypothetical protein
LVNLELILPVQRTDEGRTPCPINDDCRTPHNIPYEKLLNPSDTRVEVVGWGWLGGKSAVLKHVEGVVLEQAIL